TTTASRSMWTSTPAIVISPPSVPRLNTDERVDAEIREAEDFRVALVGHVVDAGRDIERRDIPPLGEDVIGRAEVDPVVAGVSNPGRVERHRIERLIELARHDVDLREEVEGGDGLPGDSNVADVRSEEHTSELQSRF